MREFDDELDSGADATVFEDVNVFQPHEGVENPGRLGQDEGICIFDGHTSKMAMPSSLCVVATPEGVTKLTRSSTPLKSEEPLLLSDFVVCGGA